MVRVRLVACAAVFLVCLGAIYARPLNAQSERRMTVSNMNHDVSIQRVWTAATGRNDPWDESDLDQPIPPDRSMIVGFGSGSTCFMDVKIEFSDGIVQTFSNVNICRSDRVMAR